MKSQVGGGTVTACLAYEAGSEGLKYSLQGPQSVIADSSRNPSIS